MTFFDVADEFCFSNYGSDEVASSNSHCISSSSSRSRSSKDAIGSFLSPSHCGISRKISSNCRHPLRALALYGGQSNLCYPTQQQFLDGSQPVLKLAQNMYAENRLEGARMLKDLAVGTAEESYMLQPAFFESCCAALESLQLDIFSEVRAEGEMAANAFISRCPAYAERLRHLQSAAPSNIVASRNNSFGSITV